MYILPIVMSETVCYTYYRVKEREVTVMTNMMNDRMYVIDGSREMNRRDFEHYLFELITENELFGLRNLNNGGVDLENIADEEERDTIIKRKISHHPFRLAREIFGEDRVVTYERGF